MPNLMKLSLNTEEDRANLPEHLTLIQTLRKKKRIPMMTKRLLSLLTMDHQRNDKGGIIPHENFFCLAHIPTKSIFENNSILTYVWTT
jgi:hypothetical protein